MKNGDGRGNQKGITEREKCDIVIRKEDALINPHTTKTTPVLCNML
jgi:hypothetical protein